LVSQIQTELSRLGPNDGGARYWSYTHDDFALGTTLCAWVREVLESVLSASR